MTGLNGDPEPMVDSVKRDIERARTVIEAYGADPRRWPGEDRDRVASALERDPDLQALLKAQADLDAQLGLGEDVDLGTADHPFSEAAFADLETRILADAADQNPVTRRDARRRSGLSRWLVWPDRIDQAVGGMLAVPAAWRPGSVLAASTLTGLVMGTALPTGGAQAGAERNTQERGGLEAEDYFLIGAFDPIRAFDVQTDPWAAGQTGGTGAHTPRPDAAGEQEP